MAPRTSSRTSKPAAAKAKDEMSAENVLRQLYDVLTEYFADDEESPLPKGRGKAAKPAPEPEVEEDDEDDEQSERRAELSKLTVAKLRTMAIGFGYNKDEVNAAEKADLIENILAEEAEQAGSEDSEEEVDEEESEESEEWTREDLEKLGLVALKKVAREDAEIPVEDLKGLDKESVIALILGEDEEEEDEEDEEDEAEGYTEEDLKGMGIAELKGIAKEYGVRVRPGMAKAAIVKAVLAAQDEAEDEDEE